MEASLSFPAVRILRNGGRTLGWVLTREGVVIIHNGLTWWI
jgi:hypothetical protein